MSNAKSLPCRLLASSLAVSIRNIIMNQSEILKMLNRRCETECS
jgi:hypothetical protein